MFFCINKSTTYVVHDNVKVLQKFFFPLSKNVWKPSAAKNWTIHCSIARWTGRGHATIREDKGTIANVELSVQYHTELKAWMRIAIVKAVRDSERKDFSLYDSCMCFCDGRVRCLIVRGYVTLQLLYRTLVAVIAPPSTSHKELECQHHKSSVVWSWSVSKIHLHKIR